MGCGDLCKVVDIEGDLAQHRVEAECGGNRKADCIAICGQGFYPGCGNTASGARDILDDDRLPQCLLQVCCQDAGGRVAAAAGAEADEYGDRSVRKGTGCMRDCRQSRDQRTNYHQRSHCCLPLRVKRLQLLDGR